MIFSDEKKKMDIQTEAMKRIDGMLKDINDAIDSGAIILASDLVQTTSGQPPLKTITFSINDFLLAEYRKNHANRDQ